MSEFKEDVESILKGTTYGEDEKQAYRLGADFGFSRITELEEANKRLVEAFKKYSGHTDCCKLVVGFDPCTCGYSETMLSILTNKPQNPTMEK